MRWEYRGGGIYRAECVCSEWMFLEGDVLVTRKPPSARFWESVSVRWGGHERELGH